MKPHPSSVRTLRAPTPSHTPGSRDPFHRCVQTPFLLPSSIATSSRVRLPPSPGFGAPSSFFTTRYASSSASPAWSPPAPRSPGKVDVPLSHQCQFPLPPPNSPGRPGPSRPSQSRSVHSSSPLSAQPLEREPDYDLSDAGGNYPSSPHRDWEPPLFTAEEIAGFGEPRKGERYRHMVPPRIPGGTAAVGEYEPSEADFMTADPGVSAAMDDLSWADGMEVGEEEAPDMAIWDDVPSVSQGKGKGKRKAVRRRLVVSDLPALEVGQTLGVEEERFDWRKTAPSQLGLHKRGKTRWFPDEVNVKRERETVALLKEGMGFYEEVKRYGEHFVPLLEAEHREEQLQHAERQLQWSHEKLVLEGWVVENLGATLFPLKKRPGKYIYTFAKTGKMATGAMADLPFHKFTSGTVTEICRTHPHYDFVQKDGVTHKPAEPTGGETQGDNSITPLLKAGGEKLLGSVYSVTKKYIRVEFDVPIEEIESGHWRLDIGCNDVALTRQLAAIRLLNADPTDMERQDARVAAEQSKYNSFHVSRGRSDDEDEVFNQPVRGRMIQQTVLQGTNLRDKVLRAFQEEFVPYDTSASLRIGERLGDKVEPAAVVPVPSDLQPGDIDATPVPPAHPASEPLGVLAKNELIASWTKRYRTKAGQLPVRVEGDPEVPLNPTQISAIAMMLSERLSLVQGPPGTGKTRVIIETIKLLKHHWKIPHPILVTAHTNAAVDNLVGGLREHGVKAARLGRTQSVREDLQQWTVEQLSEAHPLYQELENTGNALTELDKIIAESRKKDRMDGSEGQGKSGPKLSSGDMWDKRIKMQQKIRSMKKAITRDILLDADVVCTTCLSAASWTLDAIDFPIVFLDEASMATEPLSLVPLMKGSSHVAIIGDHKQLPPVIISEAAQMGGLATSMFERLIHEHNIPSIMLDTQYRMHPQIAAFPNRAFYASALANGTANLDGTARPGLEPPVTDFLLEDEDGRRQNVTFVHHHSPEDPSSKSLKNEGEAKRVCAVVADLLLRNPTLSGTDIGIITPYSAQIRQLTDDLRTSPARLAEFRTILGNDRMKELDNIEIRTVDGFEGREKAVIVFSTVRNNPGGYIGFLADWRRLNVGLTRAKRALIMLGSADHLARAKVGQKAMQGLPSGGAQVWRQLMGWLESEGLILREDADGAESGEEA